MALVKISKGADIRHEYTDGVSRVPVLEGAYKDAAVERISLQPGAELSPALYSKTEHNQVFLITAGKGYIATPRRVFNITEVSVFVPDFDKEQFTFHCAADAKECMEIVHFVTELNDYDKTCLKEAHLTLPRFRGVSQDGGAPRADVVDELAAVRIRDVGAFGGLDEEGIAVHVAEGPDGGVDAARYDGARAGEELGGLIHVAEVSKKGKPWRRVALIERGSIPEPMEI